MSDLVAVILFFGRFFAGRKLRGDRRTDRTFRRRGTKQLEPKDRPPPFWEFWPEYYVLLIRLSIMCLLFSSFWYGIKPTLSFTGCCAALVVCGKSRGLYEAVRTDQRVIGPLWKGLLSMGVFPKGTKVTDHLSVPPDYRRDKDTVITLRMTDDFTGDDQEKKRISRFVSRKLGGEWDAKWTEVGTTVLKLTHTPEPPKLVTFVQALKYIKSLRDGQLFIGLDSRSRPIVVDMDKETPHVCLTVGTGGGKSATLALLIVQILAWGARILAIDPKRISLNPVRHLPGITIVRDIEAQWDAIAEFRAEMERRYSILDDNPDATFERWVLIIEEGNAFYDDSVDYWDDLRACNRKLPAKPRVYKDIGASLRKGRQCYMNVVSVFQRAEAAVTGGGSARSSYGFFLMGRYKKPEWKMFVDIWPWLPSSNKPGRMTYYDGEDFGYVQVACAYDLTIEAPTLLEECTLHVLRNRPSGASAASLVPTQRSSATDGTEAVNAQTPMRDMTIREALDAGILTGNIDAIRKDIQRNGFPVATDKSGVSHRYSAADLVALEAKRTANQEASVS